MGDRHGISVALYFFISFFFFFLCYHIFLRYCDTLSIYHTWPNISHSPFYYSSIVNVYKILLYVQQTVYTLIRRHILWQLSWVYNVWKGLSLNTYGYYDNQIKAIKVTLGKQHIKRMLTLVMLSELRCHAHFWFRLLDLGFRYKFTYLMSDSADPGQLTSRSQLIWINTNCKGRVYSGSAGQGLSGV